MNKLLPSGLDDFGPVAKTGYYVDKTRFISRLLRHIEGTTTLITRPRRFGKSLMISMLDYYFSQSKKDQSSLFDGLAISKDELAKEEMNAYPVIRLTFKDVKFSSWEKAFAYIKSDLVNLACRFPELADSPKLSTYQQEQYEQLCSANASEVSFLKSLYLLSELLHLHYGKKVIILIDEYDTPISKAYSAGYYDEAIEFFRAFYGEALKGNEHLHFALVTGVMQIAQESLFSGLNNPDIDSISDGAYPDCFGFTKEETEKLLHYYGLGDRIDEVWDFYGGYCVGGYDLASPWSILKYTERDGRLACYWSSTGENEIIGRMVAKLNQDGASDFAGLVGEKKASCILRPSLSYRSLGENADDLFSYLLSAGYLTLEGTATPQGRCVVKVPNKEASTAFETEIAGLFAPRKVESNWTGDLKNAMKIGDCQIISSILSSYVLQSLNSFAYGDWKSYQYLLLGMMVTLFPDELVKSEVNAGKGRLDILVYNESEQIGLVVEVKVSSTKLSTYNIKRLAQSALNQVLRQNYAKDLFERGAKRVLAFGVGAIEDKAEVAETMLP